MFTSPDYCKQTRSLLRSESIEGNLYSNVSSDNDDGDNICDNDDDSDDSDGDMFDGSQALPWDGVNETLNTSLSLSPSSQQCNSKNGSIRDDGGVGMRSSMMNKHRNSKRTSSSHIQRNSIKDIDVKEHEALEEHHLRPIIGSMAELVSKGNQLKNVKEYLNIKERTIQRRKTMREKETDDIFTPHKQNFVVHQVYIYLAECYYFFQ